MIAASPILRAFGIFSTVMVAVACAGGPNPPPDVKPTVYRAPDEVRDVTMLWSAEPGIDLFSGQVSLVRAAYEAHFVGWAAHVPPTYPGFDQALVRRETIRSEQTARRGYNIGTMQARVQQIIGTQSEFTAEICLLNSGLMYRDGDRYRGSRGLSSNAWEVIVRAIGNDSKWPVAEPAPGPDRMHWQAPTYDVFTGWTVEFKITPHDTRCNPWALGIDPTLPEVYEDLESPDPPPIQPVYPGWPVDPPSSSPAPETSPTPPR